MTTTTPGKVDGLRERFDEVVVLRGSDREAVARRDRRAATRSSSPPGPSAQQAMTPEDRAASYREILVETAESRRRAPTARRTSSRCRRSRSTATPPTTSPRSPRTPPSPTRPTRARRCSSRWRRTYLDAAGDRACVFRCGDIFGAGDPPIEAKIAMAHQYLGGSVPFSARRAVLPARGRGRRRRDRARARVTGSPALHNLTHAEVPPTNAALFDAISAAQDLPPLVYRDEIAAPTRPISVARLDRERLRRRAGRTTPPRWRRPPRPDAPLARRRPPHRGRGALRRAGCRCGCQCCRRVRGTQSSPAARAA